VTNISDYRPFSLLVWQLIWAEIYLVFLYISANFIVYVQLCHSNSEPESSTLLIPKPSVWLQPSLRLSSLPNSRILIFWLTSVRTLKLTYRNIQ
jgi:hypothetical protein